jgi:hypothetical protein
MRVSVRCFLSRKALETYGFGSLLTEDELARINLQWQTNKPNLHGYTRCNWSSYTVRSTGCPSQNHHLWNVYLVVQKEGHWNLFYMISIRRHCWLLVSPLPHILPSIFIRSQPRACQATWQCHQRQYMSKSFGGAQPMVRVTTLLAWAACDWHSSNDIPSRIFLIRDCAPSGWLSPFQDRFKRLIRRIHVLQNFQQQNCPLLIRQKHVLWKSNCVML